MPPTGRGGRRNNLRRNKPTSSSPPSVGPTTSESLKTPSTGRTLPAELLLEILYRTEVKPLVRSKCVSKSWYALINHPIFIKKHLHFNTMNTNTHVICNGYSTCSRSKVVSLLRVDKMPVTFLDIDSRSKCSRDYFGKISFADFSKKMVLAGSINGVVLVTHMDELNGRFVCLWNPSVNQWKPIKINREGGSSGGLTRTVVGLGYDKGNDDLKIVRIVTAAVSETNHILNCKWDRVDIYSVNRDCWEDVYRGGELSFWSCQYNCNFIVKGVPYFVGVDVMPGSVGAFEHETLVGVDPSTGLFKKVHYPEHCRGEGTWAHPLEYMDSVAIMVHSTPGSHEKQMIDMYVLDMYVLDDDTTSWIKMYTLGPFPCLEFHEPQQSFKSGQIVLEKHLKNIWGLYLYDPKADCVTLLIGIDRLKPLWSESYSHSESLVTIEGMEVIKKEKNKKTKPKEMNRTELLSKDFELALHL